MNALRLTVLLVAAGALSACARSSSLSGGTPAPAATATAATSAASAEPEVGDPAPDFSLPADDGSTFTLSKADKPVILVFYPRAFTGG